MYDCCIGETNMVTVPEDTKLITLVTKYESRATCQMLCDRLNTEFLELTCTQKLFRILPNPNFYTNAIVIDIEMLTGYPSVTLLDLVMCLKTVISCKVLTDPITCMIPIGISVTLENTVADPTIIKDILRTGFVTGLYPAGDAFTLEEKVTALEHLLEHKLHIPEKINKILHEKKKTPKKTVINEIKLTPRQQQIQDLIIDKGASNKLIARMLNISESTVKLHMTQILRKHGLTNRTQLALFARPKSLESKT